MPSAKNVFAISVALTVTALSIAIADDNYLHYDHMMRDSSAEDSIEDANFNINQGAKDCDNPPAIPHGYMRPGGYQVGARRVIICVGNYQPDSGDPHASCMWNGRWNVTAHCVPKTASDDQSSSRIVASTAFSINQNVMRFTFVAGPIIAVALFFGK